MTLAAMRDSPIQRLVLNDVDRFSPRFRSSGSALTSAVAAASDDRSAEQFVRATAFLRPAGQSPHRRLLTSTVRRIRRSLRTNCSPLRSSERRPLADES